MSLDVHHVFAGDGPLGGERRSRDDVAAWFERLCRLLPGLEFQIHTLAVDGWPWDTRVGVEWTNVGALLDGSAYRNTGADIIRLCNGEIVSFHAFLSDSQAFVDAIARRHAHGVDEAAAAPIITGGTRQ